MVAERVQLKRENDCKLIFCSSKICCTVGHFLSRCSILESGKWKACFGVGEICRWTKILQEIAGKHGAYT